MCLEARGGARGEGGCPRPPGGCQLWRLCAGGRPWRHGRGGRGESPGGRTLACRGGDTPAGLTGAVATVRGHGGGLREGGRAQCVPRREPSRRRCEPRRTGAACGLILEFGGGRASLPPITPPPPPPSLRWTETVRAIEPGAIPGSEGPTPHRVREGVPPRSNGRRGSGRAEDSFLPPPPRRTRTGKRIGHPGLRGRTVR